MQSSYLCQTQWCTAKYCANSIRARVGIPTGIQGSRSLGWPVAEMRFSATGPRNVTRTIFGVILSDMIWQPHDHWINSEEWHRRRWHILWLGIPTFLALAIFGIGVGFIPGIFSPAGEDANSLQNVHHKFWFTESAKSKPQNGKSAKTPGEV